MAGSLGLHGLQHTRLPCPSLSPRVCLNSCPLSQLCYLTISSSATPFSFCPQSFPASASIVEFASCSCDSMFCWLGGLSSRGRKASTGKCSNDSIKPEVKVATSHSGLLFPLNQQVQKGVTALTGVTEPDSQGETALLPHSRGKKECVWNTGAP